MAEAGVERSIHWRQRWWYALWLALLIGALGFWRWWETPASLGVGHVVLTLRVADLPAASRVEAWVGPARDWKPGAPGFQGPWTVQDPAKPLPLPPLEIRIASRRWHQGYIPRFTTDFVVVRMDSPQGPTRFASYNLRQDLDGGLAGPHRRLMVGMPLKWNSLSTDGSRPTPLLP